MSLSLQGTPVRWEGVFFHSDFVKEISLEVALGTNSSASMLFHVLPESWAHKCWLQQETAAAQVLYRDGPGCTNSHVDMIFYKMCQGFSKTK